MMNKHRQAVAEFTAQLVAAGATGPVAQTAVQLYTISERMARRYALACNSGLTERQAAAHRRDEATVREMVAAIALDPAIVKFNFTWQPRRPARVRHEVQAPH